MTYRVSMAMRERRRIRALAMPRTGGRFAKVESDRATPKEPTAPDPVPGKPVPAGVVDKPTTHRAAKPIKTRLSRKTLVARVSTSIERELLAVEQVLGEQGAVALDGETERRARTLASLARTLRELSQLDQAKKKPKADDDDAIPRDIDDLRRALARRLDALIADAKAAHPDAFGDSLDGTAD